MKCSSCQANVYMFDIDLFNGKCVNCRERDRSSAAKIRLANSEPVSPWSVLGTFFLIGGIIGAIYFFFGFETAVSTGYGADKVNNLGLMSQRQNGLIVSIGAAVLGAVLLVVGGISATEKPKESVTSVPSPATAAPLPVPNLCIHCGKYFVGEATFCPHCGKMIDQKAVGV